MKNFASSVLPYIISLSLFSNIILAYQVYNLPKAILEGANIPVKDTVEKINTVTQTLESKSDFFYFCGSIQDSSIKISDNYDYSPKYPTEVWNGYISYAVSKKGAEFYIWSKNEAVNSRIGDKIIGWFVTDNISAMQYNGTEKYLQILYPIVEVNREAIFK